MSSGRLLQDVDTQTTAKKVSTGDELLNAVDDEARDIVITQHLDLRNKTNLVVADQINSLLDSAQLRSVRVRCAAMCCHDCHDCHDCACSRF